MTDKEGKALITILLVDDIPETRENIKKLIQFEQDMKVVGTAGTGREGIQLAKELRPDIIIMDINMPDMDGLQATGQITKNLPATAVIIMSVQDDPDYMRRAMRAGAKEFLAKPINMDELYNTIRTVYREHGPVRDAIAMGGMITPEQAEKATKAMSGGRTGNIIVVYSPQGGAGTTTFATNLAASLMREGVRVLLVDADMQFGDVPTFLNLQSPTTIMDFLDDADDLDVEHFDNVLPTHESGLKVLPGPARPEHSADLRERADAPAKILRSVAGNYDFIVVDTSVTLDDVTLELFNIATKIILLSTPSLPAIKNMRFVIDLFDQIPIPQDRYMVVLNKVYSERERKQALLGPDRIEPFLKRRIEAQIPVVDERLILSAILKGVPLIAYERDHSKPPMRQIIDFADMLYKQLVGGDDDVQPEQEQDKKKRGGLLRLTR